MSEKFSHSNPVEATPAEVPGVEPGSENDLFQTEFEIAMAKLDAPEGAVDGPEAARESKVAGIVDNLAESMKGFADYIEKSHENRIDFQEKVSANLEAKGETIKDNAKSAGRAALGFFKKLGNIGATIGTTTLGAAIIGAEAVGEKAGKAKNYASEKVKSGKDFASEKVEAGKAAAKNKAESINGKIETGIENARNFREGKKAEALARKAARQEKRDEKLLEAEYRKEAKLKNKLIMESIRKNNAAARKVARQEKVESIKDSVAEKKQAVAGGVNRLSGSALNFLKRAKSAGEAAVEDWKNYEKDDANRKTSL